MTKLLEEAIAKLQKLPGERQDEAAELLLSLVEQDQRSMHLTDDQLAEVVRRLGEPTEYASHEDVRSFFNKPGV